MHPYLVPLFLLLIGRLVVGLDRHLCVSVLSSLGLKIKVDSLNHTLSQVRYNCNEFSPKAAHKIRA